MLKRLVFFLLCLPTFAQTYIDSGTPRTVYVKHKAVHAIVGTTIVAFSYEIGRQNGHPELGRWVGIGLSFGLGVAKELYDKKHGGSFRCGDIAWTTLPGAVVSISFKW